MNPDDETGSQVGYLVPSLTHRRRGYSITPSVAPGQGEYQVVIIQGTKGTCYFLEEGIATGFIGRLFMWCKPVGGECYETRVGANYQDWACTCTAGRVHQHLCKHAEVLWDAIHKGFLPSKPF